MLQWVLLSYTIEEKTTSDGVLLSYTIEEKTTWGLMLQWVLLSYTIEEKTTWVWWYSEYC